MLDSNGKAGWIALSFLSIAMTACGGGGSGGKGESESRPSSEPDAQTGTCTYALNANITVPTRLVNTDSSCDYFLEGSVRVTSNLIIDPGVRIVVGQDSEIILEGGEIHAVGTEDQRITFESENNIAGFWYGIRLYEGRESEFRYVDIKDAGEVCHTLFCPDISLLLDNVVVSLTHSTVSNSYSRGLVVFTQARFKEFSNNRFYGNAWNGIEVDISQIPSLDSNSDYAGGDQPNGTPYVMISGEQTEGEHFPWKKLNAPYYVPSQIVISGGYTTIAPGIEVLFGYQATLRIEGNGELNATGNVSSPIIFRGLEDVFGYWVGIEFDESASSRNEFTNVEIHHAGEKQSIIALPSAIYLTASNLRMNNLKVTQTNGWAISCSEGDNFFTPWSYLSVSGIIEFTGNSVDLISNNCVVSNTQ